MISHASAGRVRGLALVLTMAVAGCDGDRTVPSLAPVPLPDLSRTDGSVRNQIQTRHAALTRARAEPAIAPLELAREFGDMGRLFLAAELPAAAEACFVNAETLAPGEMRWPYYLGQVYRTRGDLAQAASAFERVLRLQPSDVPALIWNGRVHLDLGRPEAAEALFATALAVRPGTFAAQFGLGRAALERRSYARAVRELEAALAIAPHASVAHYPLATAYRGLGDQARADAHMQQRGSADVIPPDPLMEEIALVLESPLAYQRRGLEALGRQSWAEAAAHFGKGLELQPAVPVLRESLRNKRGAALFQMGDAQGARQQFEEGIRQSPWYAPHHVGLGILMVLDGLDREAIQSLRMAVRIDPAYPEARLQLADALRRSGTWTESIQQYDEALRLDPRLSDATFGSAMAMVRLGRYRDAVARLTAGTRRHPGERRFVHAIARLLATAPDAVVRDGARALSMARELQASGVSVELAETMAMALAEVGHFTDAVEWQRQVIAAVRQSGDDARRGQALVATLAGYERGEPSRTPWSPDDAIHTPVPVFR